MRGKHALCGKTSLVLKTSFQNFQFFFRKYVSSRAGPELFFSSQQGIEGEIYDINKVFLTLTSVRFILPLSFP